MPWLTSPFSSDYITISGGWTGSTIYPSFTPATTTVTMTSMSPSFWEISGQSITGPESFVPASDQAAYTRRRLEFEQREQQRRVASARAQDRAVETLLGLLSPEQVAQYQEDRRFEVLGSAGRRYRIRPGTAGNVDLLDAQGLVVAELCAHPQLWDGQGNLPLADVALAQMLALTTDEREFLRIANVQRGRLPAGAL